MTTATIPSLESSIQKTNEWLGELRQELGRDDQYAYRSLRAVLHALRDRMTVEEATDLGAQLPMVVRGFYYEAWNPSKTPTQERNREAFLQHVGKELSDTAQEPPENAVRAVFSTLAKHCTGGQIDHVKSNLPSDVQDLWPA